MSCVPAQSHLGTLQCLLLALVEHGFVTRLSSAEQVVDDSGKLVNCTCDSLRFSELAAYPAEEFSHVVFGMVQRTCRQTKCDGNPASDWSALGEEHFSAADLLFRAQADPRGERGCIAEGETSVPTSRRIVCEVIALMPGTFVRSTPKIR
jgi:hypothetical protein